MFIKLLKSVPGLEEKLLNTESEEEIHSIAVMVSPFGLLGCSEIMFIARLSFKKEPPVLDLMIQKV